MHWGYERTEKLSTVSCTMNNWMTCHIKWLQRTTEICSWVHLSTIVQILGFDGIVRNTAQRWTDLKVNSWNLAGTSIQRPGLISPWKGSVFVGGWLPVHASTREDELRLAALRPRDFLHWPHCRLHRRQGPESQGASPYRWCDHRGHGELPRYFHGTSSSWIFDLRFGFAKFSCGPSEFSHLEPKTHGGWNEDGRSSWGPFRLPCL